MYYIFIDRQHAPTLVVGPYKNGDEAVLAMESSLVIDELVEIDCLDCYVSDQKEYDELSPDENECVIHVQENNPDFFGYEDKATKK